MQRVQRALAIVVVLAVSISTVALGADNLSANSARAPILGHVLEALTKATPVGTSNSASDQTLTLTIVLRRGDEAGFQKYLGDVYNPTSAKFRQFLKPQEIADQFGPTPADYAIVSSYFQANGFSLVETSSNRMTLVVAAPRSATEAALSVQIKDYQLNDTRFFANVTEPSLPATIAARVAAVIGLSNLATPARSFNSLLAPLEEAKCPDLSYQALVDQHKIKAGEIINTGSDIEKLYNQKIQACVDGVKAQIPQHAPVKAKSDPPPPAWIALDGTGQKVGLVEFDTFQLSDVNDYIQLTGLPDTTINNVSQIHVSGGASPGSQQAEVLLDIDDLVSSVPGAQVEVYDAPFSGGGSFQAVFNAMINGGVGVISNSWTYCEDQTTLADVQSIESVLQTAAGAGITVLSATGDFGSNCWNGSPSTAGVPTTSPHITAVGGTSLEVGPGFTYDGETWWDSSGNSPPGGQGGFGISKFFARPVYQNGQSSSAMRSIPDVTTSADAAKDGVIICQASGGGCPTGSLYGGTSSSTPLWAGYVALLNQAQGTHLGFLNSSLYSLAGTNAFHDATSMVTDFAHVGLGTPNLARLHEHLTAQTPGNTDAGVSELRAWTTDLLTLPPGIGVSLLIPADGTSNGFIVVRLSDALGNIVDGHGVSLVANPSGNVVIQNVPTTDVGVAIFSVTDSAAEKVTFSASDTTANVVLQDTATVQFIGPPATSGGIVSNPSSVPADGSSSSTITITLKNALNQPSPGKQIALSQGGAHSIITGPSPAVTDVNGQIQYTVTDDVGETVSYTAIDITDDGLPVPGSASVTFTGAGASCVASPPTAAAGFTLTPFANGFAAQNFFYSGVNWGGCPGASNPAFDTSGNVFVSDFFTGKLSKFGLAGGAISSANTLATIGQTLQQPAFGKDGNLYVARGATGGGSSTGIVARVDPNTGAVLQTVVSGLTCPSPLAVDPLSGDLFFTDTCFGAGADNPSLWRIENPASASPTLVVYATLPSTPNGAIAFAPNGTMYVVNAYNGAGNVIQVAGTNTPSPPAMTTLTGISSDFWITMGQAQVNGAAKSLLVHNNNALKLVDITTNPFTTTVLANGAIGSGTIGPDGCLYAEASDTVLKLAPSSGSCGLVPTNPGPSLSLSPTSVTPNPAQGATQTLTAKFVNVSVPVGTPVQFDITGTNKQLKLAVTDATGSATVTYIGRVVGTDTIVAFGPIGSGSSPVLFSNTANITWGAGKHLSYLNLNITPQGGNSGQNATLTTTLLDVSANSPVPIVGAPVQMSVGSKSCSGTTNGNGVAKCSVTLPTPGTYSFTASYAGDSTHTAANTSQGFTVLSVAGAGTVPGAPTIDKVTAGNNQVTVGFSPPSNNGGSPITSYIVACTPQGGGPAITATGTASPITVTGLSNGATYTCTVSAVNAVGPGPASPASNPVTLAVATPAPIPTLSQWALVALVASLLLLGIGALRRRR